VQALESQGGAALDARLGQQVRHVELHCALGDGQLAGALFLVEVFQQRVEDFPFAPAEMGGTPHQAMEDAAEHLIHEARKQGTRNPEATCRQCLHGPPQLRACLPIAA